ncbi:MULTISPECIES: LptF/LptG family permease [unclassified Candidatus Cardinium]|uniref:LptF/LptG family permease n=1 Tax=unclassified Candidatus Cardinium TaxID=2641185 RepID=UPI001FB219A2|nr:MULTISPECIES: LptF/LptG family permease [unclassified Candidatus Cardinium]
MSNIGIKKIDKLLLRTFVTTFILLLVLVLFVMVIQTFFAVFSNIAGKGLGIRIYSKLLFYLCLNIVPDAFPVAILMTSLIVFGNFSESCELTAMRSVGLSLQRTLQLPFIFILVLSSTLFYFQHYIYPNSKQKIFALVSDIWKKKSALFIQQGIFCNNIPGYSIRVDKKSTDNESMEGIIVYDYTKKYGTVSIITAEQGRLYTTPDEGYLVMELTNGHNYVEPLPAKHDDATYDQKPSFYRNGFSSQKLRISLEALKLGKTNAKYALEPRTRTRPQLKKMIEERAQGLVDYRKNSQKFLVQEAIHYYGIAPSSLSLNHGTIEGLASTLQTTNQEADFILLRDRLVEKKINSGIESPTQPHDYTLQRVVQDALYHVKKRKKALIHQRNDETIVQADLNDALYQQEHRCAIAMRCVIMFLLAAPLGCIIRRGGFGISVIISSFFILLEYILSIFGRDYAMSGAISTFMGAWLPNFMLLPFCCFFLVKAEQGRGLWSTDWYAFYIKVKNKIKRKTTTTIRS